MEERALFVSPLADISLNAAAKVVLDGVERSPDPFKAFALITCGYAFPAVNAYGEGVHPAVLAAGFESLRDNPVNLSHAMKMHGAPRDRIVGSVVQACFAALDQAVRWSVKKGEEPHGTALIALWKLAEGMDKIIGRHQTGRQRYAVSQEIVYSRDDSGFAIEVQQGDARMPRTPDDLWTAGWNYVPVAEADTDLMASRDWEKKRMRKKGKDGHYHGEYWGRRTHLLLNGLVTPMLYSGVALVDVGAEDDAGIETLLASFGGDEAMASEVFTLLQSIREIRQQTT